MKQKNSFLLATFVLITLACSSLLKPTSNATSVASSPNSPLIPPTISSESNSQCDAEIFITSVTEGVPENGMKVVLATLGIKNTGSVWMELRGPDGDWIVLQTDPPTYLTTKDGSIYEYSHSYGEDAPLMTMEVLPPGFVTLGVTLGAAYPGDPLYYNLRFDIPAAQIPDSITIGQMGISCFATGIARYPFLPDKTYDLSSDVTEAPAQKSGSQYPDLVDSLLQLPNGEGKIEFTGVTRSGDTLTITFNFTNLSPSDAPPPFSGYIIGDGRLSTCFVKIEGSCPVDNFNAVPPGQTQTFSAMFNVLQHDTNLKFVYVHGNFEEPNVVYKINAK